MTGDRRKPAAALIALAILLASPFPVRAGLFDDDVARRQIVEQSRRIDELKQQNEALAGRLNRIDEALKVNPAIELAQQLELLRQELKQLRGQIEVLGNDVQSAIKRSRDMYVDLDARLRRFEQPATGAAPAAPPPAAATIAAAPAASPAPAPAATPAPAAGAASPPAQGISAPSSAEQSAYESAQNQRRIGNYPGAIASFQTFIAQHPNSLLAPRAQYWIGDSYYNLRDFKSSMAAQQKLIATWPDSSSVPDAMLNLASSQIELGDTESARKTMGGLITRYPVSDAAEKAKRRLATLR